MTVHHDPNHMDVPTLLISGTVGSGKTTITTEISDILTDREVPHAAVDLDALVWQWPPTSKWNNDLLFANLAALWPNYRAHGAERLVLAHVLEDPTDLHRYHAAIPGAAITICRLVSPHERRTERLRRRMQPGPSLDWHLNRTGELEANLAALALEDFTVTNDDRPVRDVALEVLSRAGW